MQRTVPGPLWIALVSLAVITVVQLFITSQVGIAALVGPLVNVALIVGLYLGRKWAYVLTMVFVVLGILIGLSKSASYGLAVLVIDCLVLIPVLICTRYYFPELGREPPTDRPEASDSYAMEDE